MELSESLFWDVDIKSIDLNSNKQFVITRIIERGSIDDWIRLKEFYGIDTIRKKVIKIRNLNKKTFHFFSNYFGIDKQDFRCHSNNSLFIH